MRNLLILILIGIALAVVRWLVTDVVQAVKKSVGSTNDDEGRSAGARRGSGHAKSGHLVRDPVSGTYIDEKVAIQAEVNGQTFFFESRSNRDEYVKRARAGQA